MSVAIKFDQKYYTTREAAEEIGVDVDTVKRYCNATPPRLRAEKVGHAWMIPQSEIDRYNAEENDRGRPRNRNR